MLEDNLVSLAGFETPDSAKAIADKFFETLAGGADETLNASADMPAQSDPVGHLQEEMRILNTKVDQLESNISKKVVDDIQSSIPLLVVDTLKAHLLGLLSGALKNTLPQMLKDSIKQSVLESIKEKLSLFDEQGEQHTGDATMANAQGEKPPAQEISNVEQAPAIPEYVNEENALVLYASVKKSSKPDVTTMTIEQFTEHLTKTTSSIFSPSLPREPTPPRDLTPPRDESKGKGIAIEETLKEIIPFMEEGGLVPKMPNFKSFSTLDGQMTNDDVMTQLKEMKRLADLKAEKEKSEKSLKKIFNPATIRAQAQKMAEYEAKRKKMFDEYNHQITHRADQLPITKISYRVNSSKEATMRITRGNNPLNLTIYDGIPPPPELSTFRASINDKKGKRSSEILKEVFVKEDVLVDGMHRNLVPPIGVEVRKGLVIREPESGVFFYNENFDLVFQREEEFHLATTPQVIRLQNSF
ncbi:hypothetical protein Tco_0734391 [Tanacetum coccineum]